MVIVKKTVGYVGGGLLSVVLFLLGSAGLTYYWLAGAYGGAVLKFPTIDDGLSQQTSFQMPAAADDCVTPNWPALPAGVLGIMFVDRPGSITVRLFNFSGAPVTPPALLYRARTNACAK